MRFALPDSWVSQDRQRLFRRERIAQIAEIDEADELLRRHLGDQAPDRLAFELGPEIPERIDHRGRRQMDDALLRPDPAQLARRDELAPIGAHGAGDVGKPPADHQRRQSLDRRHAELVAATQREGEAMPLQPRLVSGQHHIGRRIIGIGIHGIGAVRLARGGKADVAGAAASDLDHEARLCGLSEGR